MLQEPRPRKNLALLRRRSRPYQSAPTIGSTDGRLGTGMVYPTLLAAITDIGCPSWRASALGVYRLWRDSGYAFGALLGGEMSDVFGIRLAVATIVLLTALSGLVTFLLLPETVQVGLH